MQESVDFIVGIEDITKQLCYAIPLNNQKDREDQATASVSLIHKPYITRTVNYSIRPLQLFNNGPSTQVYDTTLKNGPYLEAECQIPTTARIITDADTSTMVDGVCINIDGIEYVGWDFSKGTNVNDYFLGLHYNPKKPGPEKIPFATAGGTTTSFDPWVSETLDGVRFYILQDSPGQYRAGDVLISSLQVPYIDQPAAVCRSYNGNYEQPVGYSNLIYLYPKTGQQYSLVGVDPDYISNPSAYQYVMDNYAGIYINQLHPPGDQPFDGWVVPQKWIDEKHQWPAVSHPNYEHLSTARSGPYWLNALTLYHMDVPAVMVDKVQKFQNFLEAQSLSWLAVPMVLTENGYHVTAEPADDAALFIIFHYDYLGQVVLSWIDCRTVTHDGRPPRWELMYDYGTENAQTIIDVLPYVCIPMIGPSEHKPINTSWSDNLSDFRNIYLTPDISALKHSLVHGQPTDDAVNVCFASGAYGLLMVSRRSICNNSRHVHHVPAKLRGVLTNTLNGYYLTLIPTMRLSNILKDRGVRATILGYWVVYSQFGFLS